MSDNENPKQPSDLIKGLSQVEAQKVDDALTFQLPAEDFFPDNPNIPTYLPTVHNELNNRRTKLSRLVDDKDNHLSIADILEESDDITRQQKYIDKTLKSL